MVILAISSMPLWPIGSTPKAGGPMIIEPLRGYVRAGHQVHFIFPSGSDYQRQEDGIQLHPFRLSFGLDTTKIRGMKTNGFVSRLCNILLAVLFPYLFGFSAIRYAINIGQKIKPDVIYALTEQSVVPAYIVSKLLHTRLISRLYGNDLYYYKNTLYVSGLRKLREFKYLIPYIVPADYLIMTNDGTYGNLLAKSLGVPEHRIIYWLNGVYKPIHRRSMDEVRAIKRALNIAEDAKIIISTARFGPVKRVDRVITALPEVFKAVPNSVCLVVGDGSEAQKIDTLCANLGIQDRVIFTGALSNEKVLECLEAADIFVSFGEQSNLGNALLEALSHGKCIVSLDVGGIQEIITAGQNGVLVKETELDKIPHVLIQLLNDDEYRNTLARNAKEFAEHKLLTWEERARKEVCLIEELVNHT